MNDLKYFIKKVIQLIIITSLLLLIQLFINNSHWFNANRAKDQLQWMKQDLAPFIYECDNIWLVLHKSHTSFDILQECQYWDDFFTWIVLKKIIIDLNTQSFLRIPISIDELNKSLYNQ